jgi:hypothetical protein
MDEPPRGDRGAARGIAIGMVSGGILWVLIGLALWLMLGAH